MEKTIEHTNESTIESNNENMTAAAKASPARLVIRVICFFVILAAVVLWCTKPFKVHETQMFQHMEGFYAEEPGSLDAVYVGASNVYQWWEPPVAWRNTGITSFDFSVPTMAPRALKYMIEEARKTQPDALYIINLNNFRDDRNGYVEIHNIADFMHLSGTKIAMINALSSNAGIKGLDKLEFYLPFIRFHSGWTELTTTDFGRKVNGLKGGDVSNFYIQGIQDLSAKKTSSAERTEMKDYQQEILGDLIDYCKAEGVRVLFVAEPQLTVEANVVGETNSMADLAESQGMDVLNLWEDSRYIREIGLDLSQDFRDEKHVNVHGGAKYSRYLARYLQDKYGFEDKRGRDGYDDWDKASSEYSAIISPYTLDLERTDEPRDPDLAEPDILSCEEHGNEIYLKWKAVDNADAYAIYRKKLLDSEGNTSDWERVGETEDSEYTDTSLRNRKTYYYTVVPVRYEGSAAVYGNFSYTGEEEKTTVIVPQNVRAVMTDDGVGISWDAAPEVDGYAVYKKIKGEPWKRIGKVGADELTFTDVSEITDDCLYSVASYVYKSDGKIKYGYYDPAGVRISGKQ